MQTCTDNRPKSQKEYGLVLERHGHRAGAWRHEIGRGWNVRCMPCVMLGADTFNGRVEGIYKWGTETREAHWGLRSESPSLLAPCNRMGQPVGIPALLSSFRVASGFLGRTVCPIAYLRLPESLTYERVENGSLLFGKHSNVHKLPSSTGDRVCWGVLCICRGVDQVSVRDVRVTSQKNA